MLSTRSISLCLLLYDGVSEEQEEQKEVINSWEKPTPDAEFRANRFFISFQLYVMPLQRSSVEAAVKLLDCVPLLWIRAA